MIRAVLDVNVIVSSFIHLAGVPGRIRSAWERGAFRPCLSLLLFDDIGRVLSRPNIMRSARLRSDDIPRILNDLREIAIFADEPVAVQRVVMEDPDDDIVFATALATGADVIVSGDKHLLNLRSYEAVPILTPRQFLEMLISASGENFQREE